MIQKKELENLMKLGYSNRKIAKELFVSPLTVTRYQKKYGIYKPYQHATPKEKVLEIEKMLMQKKTQKEIILKTGVSDKTIQKIKKRLLDQQKLRPTKKQKCCNSSNEKINKSSEMCFLKKDIEALKSYIFHYRKEDKVVFPVRAENYDQAYSMANDLIALIHKLRKGNDGRE